MGSERTAALHGGRQTSKRSSRTGVLHEVDLHGHDVRAGLRPSPARSQLWRSYAKAPGAAENKQANLKQGDSRGSNLEPRESVGKVRKTAATGTGYSGTTLDKVDKIRAQHLDGHDGRPGPDGVRGVAVARGPGGPRRCKGYALGAHPFR